jgi:hypothetical protein
MIIPLEDMTVVVSILNPYIHSMLQVDRSFTLNLCTIVIAYQITTFFALVVCNHQIA